MYIQLFCWTETSDININGTRVLGNKPFSLSPPGLTYSSSYTQRLSLLHHCCCPCKSTNDPAAAIIDIFSFTVTIVFPMCVLQPPPKTLLHAKPTDAPNATA